MPTPSNPETHSTKNHVLIDGTFEPADAKEVLLTIIKGKVDFHHRRSMSSWERFGKYDEASDKRVEEFKVMRREIIETLDKAEAAGQVVKLNSLLSVTLVNQPVTH